LGTNLNVHSKGEKMADKKFKIGVSDWEVTFESGEVVIFNTVISESVTTFADGREKIKLENATFDAKFIELFKKGIKTIGLKEKFILMDSTGDIKESLEYNHICQNIKNIKIISALDNVATVTVTFA